MLSRVADNLYWMSRYMERAEHTARLLNVQLNVILDQSPQGAGKSWQRMLASLRTPHSEERRSFEVTRLVALDHTNRNSVISCLAAARDNARNVREQISADMWEDLNRYYFRVKEFQVEQIFQEQRHDFFRTIASGSNMFVGITDSTMSHGEGWRFIQVGRFLERATLTATLLDAYYCDINMDSTGDSGFNYVDWVGLLHAASALEAYRKVYTAEVLPERIAEFLLLNDQFPHSVCFAAEVINGALAAVEDITATRRADRVRRAAGRLRSGLNYGQIDELLASGLHNYLNSIQIQCQEIHAAFHEVYIGYPVADEFSS